MSVNKNGVVEEEVVGGGTGAGLSEAKLWQCLLAEAIGTFTLVFMGCSAVVANDYLIEIASGFALTLLALIVSLGPISGAHFNPAVTIPMMVAREIKPLKAVLYIVSQLVGSILAGFLAAAYPHSSADYAQYGTTTINKDITVGHAFVLEMLATTFLVGVIFSTAVSPSGNKKAAPFVIALVVLADIIAFAPWTGASMNPARSFGPALAGNQWRNHWVYWLAPILGGLMGLAIHYALSYGRTSKRGGEYQRLK